MSKQSLIKQYLKPQEKSDEAVKAPEVEDDTEDEEPQRPKMSLEQFSECTNVQELVLEDMRKKIPHRFQKSFLHIDKYVEQVYEKFMSDSVYRKKKNHLFKNLVFAPKPWLTRKDRELLKTHNIGECRVNMLEDNIVYDIGEHCIKRGIVFHGEQAAEAIRASVPSYVTDLFDIYLKKKGSFEKALSHLKKRYGKKRNSLESLSSNDTPMSKGSEQFSRPVDKARPTTSRDAGLQEGLGLLKPSEVNDSVSKEILATDTLTLGAPPKTTAILAPNTPTSRPEHASPRDIHPAPEVRERTVKEKKEKSNEAVKAPEVYAGTEDEELMPPKMTLEQFSECTNIQEVIIEDMKKRIPDHFQKSVLHIDKYVKQVYEKFMSDPVYRKKKNHFFKNLVFAPKPWLTRKDRELLKTHNIGECCVNMLEDNIVYDIGEHCVKRGIVFHGEQAAEAIRASVPSYVTDLFDIYLKKKGSFEKALKHLKKRYLKKCNSLESLSSKDTPMSKGSEQFSKPVDKARPSTSRDAGLQEGSGLLKPSKDNDRVSKEIPAANAPTLGAPPKTTAILALNTPTSRAKQASLRDIHPTPEDNERAESCPSEILNQDLSPNKNRSLDQIDRSQVSIVCEADSAVLNNTSFRDSREDLFEPSLINFSPTQDMVVTSTQNPSCFLKPVHGRTLNFDDEPTVFHLEENNEQEDVIESHNSNLFFLEASSLSYDTNICNPLAARIVKLFPQLNERDKVVVMKSVQAEFCEKMQNISINREDLLALASLLDANLETVTESVDGNRSTSTRLSVGSIRRTSNLRLSLDRSEKSDEVIPGEVHSLLRKKCNAQRDDANRNTEVDRECEVDQNITHVPDLRIVAVNNENSQKSQRDERSVNNELNMPSTVSSDIQAVDRRKETKRKSGDSSSPPAKRNRTFSPESITFDEFKRYTNVEEIIRADIMKKYPITYNKYLHNMEKLIKRFYKSYVKGRKDWPKGLYIKLRSYQRNDSSGTGTNNISNESEKEQNCENHIANTERLGNVPENIVNPSPDLFSSNEREKNIQASVVNQEDLINNVGTAEEVDEDNMIQEPELINVEDLQLTQSGRYTNREFLLDPLSASLNNNNILAGNMVMLHICKSEIDLGSTPTRGTAVDGNESRQSLISPEKSLNCSRRVKRELSSSSYEEVEYIPSEPVEPIVLSDEEMSVTQLIDEMMKSPEKCTDGPYGLPRSFKRQKTNLITKQNAETSRNSRCVPESVSETSIIQPLVSEKNSRMDLSAANNDAVAIGSGDKSIEGQVIATNVELYGNVRFNTSSNSVCEQANEPVLPVEDRNLSTDLNIPENVYVVKDSAAISSETLSRKQISMYISEMCSVVRPENSPPNELLKGQRDELELPSTTNERAEHAVIDVVDNQGRNRKRNIQIQNKFLENRIAMKKLKRAMKKSNKGKITDETIVPQKTHTFGPLQLIHKTKDINAPSTSHMTTEETTTSSDQGKDLEDVDMLIEDASQDLVSLEGSNSSNKFSASELLSVDNSIFASSQLGRTALNANKDCSQNSTAHDSSTPSCSELKSPTPVTLITVNELQSDSCEKSGHEIVISDPEPRISLQRMVSPPPQFGYITYLSLHQITLNSKSNELNYESRIPFLQPMEKQPMQATINFRSNGFNQLNICGESLRLLLGLSKGEWSCFLCVLGSIGTFRYQPSDPEPAGKSLPYRVLYYFFKTLPKFTQVTYEFEDSNINHIKCVQVKTTYTKPAKCLTQVLDPFILESMAKLKQDLSP